MPEGLPPYLLEAEYSASRGSVVRPTTMGRRYGYELHKNSLVEFYQDVSDCGRRVGKSEDGAGVAHVDRLVALEDADKLGRASGRGVSEDGGSRHSGWGLHV